MTGNNKMYSWGFSTWFILQYTEDIKESFENTDISIATVTLLTPAIVAQLKSFSDKAGSVNFNSAIDQVCDCEQCWNHFSLRNIVVWMLL